MKTVEYELITDSRFDAEPLVKMNDLVNQLLNTIEDKMTVENLHAVKPRLLDNWGDGTFQYRTTFKLIPVIKLTRTAIYQILNTVQARQLKFI